MKEPTPEQVEAARALIAQADAAAQAQRDAEAADRQAKADAIAATMKGLVTGEAFKGALGEMEAVIAGGVFGNTELTYAVQMMHRLRDTFAG